MNHPSHNPSWPLPAKPVHSEMTMEGTVFLCLSALWRILAVDLQRVDADSMKCWGKKKYPKLRRNFIVCMLLTSLNNDLDRGNEKCICT